MFCYSFDVMHIKKNVRDNVLYTLWNDSGMIKDHLHTRKDLQVFGLHKEACVDNNGKFQLVRFTLTRRNKEVYLATLKSIQVLNGHSSNISRCIDLKAQKFSSLKSHDCHILIHQFLPLALKEILPTNVSVVLVKFCSFFHRLYSKVLTLVELD